MVNVRKSLGSWRKCVSISILANTNFSKPFKLHTDAWTLGLGAILYQNQDAADWVIGYASRTLSKAEHNYLAHQLEFLALKWMIMEQFHEYLYGITFVLYTDNNPLTCILTSVKLDATGHHLVASLENYNFAWAIGHGRWVQMWMLYPIFWGRSIISILRLTQSLHWSQMQHRVPP